MVDLYVLGSLLAFFRTVTSIEKRLFLAGHRSFDRVPGGGRLHQDEAPRRRR